MSKSEWRTEREGRKPVFPTTTHPSKDPGVVGHPGRVLHVNARNVTQQTVAINANQRSGTKMSRIILKATLAVFITVHSHFITSQSEVR
jgi:hypothetical protein